MVDLHDSLRPAGAQEPLPIDELARRVGRRRRRRAGAVSGLAAVALGGAIALGALSGSSSSPIVADSAPADTAPTDAAPPDSAPTDAAEPQPARSTVPVEQPADREPTPLDGPEEATDPGDGDEPVTTPGIRTTSTTTSTWEDGYCMQIDVVNEGTESQVWQVVLDMGGAIDELWNAAADDLGEGNHVFSGESGYNTVLAPGATTAFGTCINTTTD